MHKLKKITLRKEVLDRINENQMDRLKGGMNLNCTSCQPIPHTSQCPNTSAYDCPNTCGSSWTCNG